MEEEAPLRAMHERERGGRVGGRDRLQQGDPPCALLRGGGCARGGLAGGAGIGRENREAREKER